MRLFLLDVYSNVYHNSFVSLSEIQNAKGLMDVLAEMLSALEPGNKEVTRFCRRGI